MAISAAKNPVVSAKATRNLTMSAIVFVGGERLFGLFA